MMAPMSQIPGIARPHVLVVDDETVLAGMVANYLQQAGFRTTVLHDGPSAVTSALSLACFEMMAVMHLGMGSSHRH